MKPSFLRQTGPAQTSPASSCKYSHLCILLQAPSQHPLSPKVLLTTSGMAPEDVHGIAQYLATNHFVLCSHHPGRSPRNTYRSITPASGLLWCLRRDQATAVKPLEMTSAPSTPGLVAPKAELGAQPSRVPSQEQFASCCLIPACGWVRAEIPANCTVETN